MRRESEALRAIEAKAQGLILDAIGHTSLGAAGGVLAFDLVLRQPLVALVFHPLAAFAGTAVWIRIVRLWRGG